MSVNECLTGGVICAKNATCYDLQLGYACRCDRGFEGDGYKSCTLKPFEHLTTILLIVIILFFVLLFIFVYFICKQKSKDELEEKDPYDLEWKNVFVAMNHQSRKRYENVAIVKRGDTAEPSTPVQTNEPKYDTVIIEESLSKTRNESHLTEYDIKRQKSKLKSLGDSGKQKVIITSHDDTNDISKHGIYTDSIDQTDGVDNLAFEPNVSTPNKKETPPHPTDFQESIELTSFKPLDAKDTLSPKTPEPYSSRDSFKEIQRTPKTSPKKYSPSISKSDVSNMA